MFKKLIPLIICISIAQSVFALDRSELGLDFFAGFNDDYLNCYINQALENNHDLKKAAAVVEQYRQAVKYSLGSELPSFNVSANYLGIKIPELDDFELKRNAFVLPFSANYEADLLLKNRDKTRSTKKSYEAGLYEEKGIYISLLSDIATVYTNILMYDEVIKNQSEISEISEEIYKADERKYVRGVIDTDTLNNSRRNMLNSRNELSRLEKERAELLNQLAVLTGNSPECAVNLERGNLANFDYSGTIPDSVPSDVIFARPDVMSAEKKLEKAKIDVRVARKEFLPTFNITGYWAFSTLSPGTFFSWESSLAAIMAGATQDIFTGGKKVANLKTQKAKYEELFEDYRQTDLNAVKEVNTALCFVKHDTEIENNSNAKLILEEKNFNNSEKKYNRGVISYPEYINEKSRFESAAQDAANAKTQRIVNYFTLYKAVGGRL